MQKSKKLAIFDIDGTIFRSSLLIELIKELVNVGLFPLVALKELEDDFDAWVQRKGPYGKYVEQVVRVYLKYIAGLKFTEVEEAARRVVNKEKNRVYRFTRNLIEELKTKDYYLVVISGSPEYIVDIFAQTLGFDASFGQRHEVIEGVLTGQTLERDTVERKEKVVERLIESTGLRFDLAQSIAVGDSMGDLTLLETVGYPIAFNPEFKLAEIAKGNGWRIVVERKNAIYDLGDFTLVPHNEVLEVGGSVIKSNQIDFFSRPTHVESPKGGN